MSIYLSPACYKSTLSPLFTAMVIQFMLTPGILVPPGLPEKQPLLQVVVVQLLSPVWVFAYPMDCSRPGSSVLPYLLELAQIYVHSIRDALTISSSAASFSLCLQCFPASGSFPKSQLFTSGGQRIGALALTSNEYSGLISFRIDLLDLLAVQGTLKSLLQHHDLKASILQHSVSFSTSKASLLYIILPCLTLCHTIL